MAEAATATIVNGWKLVRLNSDDTDEVMQYLIEHFIPNEPSARSIHISSSEGWSMTEAVVHASLQFPYSYALRNENGEIIAVRLATVMERPNSDETNKCEGLGVFTAVKEKELCKDRHGKPATSAIEMTRLISALESKIWNLVDPSTKKLLAILIISTHEKYTRRGLMHGLLTFDLAEQKRYGIDGAVSEATAFNSQRLLSPWAKKASSEGQQEFQSIVDNEMQNIDTVYMKLKEWATNQGPDFVEVFKENFKKTEKEAFEKRDELGTDVDRLPPLVLDAFQAVDMFRQDPTRSDLEEKKMIRDLKKTVEPLFVSRYEILLDRAQKLQDTYGINVFRSPFVKRRKRYFEVDEL